MILGFKIKKKVAAKNNKTLLKIEKINLIWTSLSICTYYISRHGRVRHRLWKPKILKTEYVRFHSKTFENVDFTLKKWYFWMKNVSFKIKIWIKNCENLLKLRKFEWVFEKIFKGTIFNRKSIAGFHQVRSN